MKAMLYTDLFAIKYRNAMKAMFNTDIKMIHITLISQIPWIIYQKKLSIAVRIVQISRGIAQISEKIMLKKLPEFYIC